MATLTEQPMCKPPYSRAILVLALLTTTSLRAEIKLASAFTDHAVLQRGLPVQIWGRANPGSKIHVAFADQEKSVTTDGSGKWQVSLDALVTAHDGQILKVSSDSEESPVELKDILVGEVWLASGQSNMDFSVAKTPKHYFAGTRDEIEEIAAAEYPELRMFTGEWTMSNQPKETLAGEWKVCTPENVRDFSAVAYFFARELHKTLKVPVGIVTLAYGASTAQSWVQREAVAADAKLSPILEDFDAKVKQYVPPSPDEIATWEAAVEKAKDAGKRAPRKPWNDPVQDQHNPTILFNGMVWPMVPYAMRGVIWYQGESITGPKELFPRWNETLIKNWRQLWSRQLPFYFCQLAAHKASSGLPAVREMQSQALELPKTGMAVTIDIGDENNVHPKNKQDVGARLSRIALARTYGLDIEDSGPILIGAQADGASLRLKFSHLAGGLTAKDGPLRTFEITGADKKYYPAEAEIEGDTVVVHSAEVPFPLAARYAWSSYPEGCNLYNQAGLPAAPFRSDALAKP